MPGHACQHISLLCLEETTRSAEQCRNFAPASSYERVLSFQYFGKGRHPAKLNFGDCFSYAAAKIRNEPLLFKGNDFNKSDIVCSINWDS